MSSCLLKVPSELEFQKKYEAQQEENRVQQSIIRRLLLERDTPES